ncbi:MAG: hypothetical protein L6R41_001429 [Letrouitia leprolyta]|nr:MAG: hypothetical protein L6R41_001429 [Letrouitia leprolyta]
MDPNPFGWPDGEILPAMFQRIPMDNLRLIRRIGFSVIDRSTFQASERDWRMWHDFRGWISQRLPNLEHTYIYLFGPSTPSQRFLYYLVRLLDAIPGQKTIEYRASNHRKRMVGNTLAEVFGWRHMDAPSIKVLGGWYVFSCILQSSGEIIDSDMLLATANVGAPGSMQTSMEKTTNIGPKQTPSGRGLRTGTR